MIDFPSEILGLKVSTLSAGFIGGLISLASQEKTSFIKSTISTLVGTVCAAYFTPVITSYLSLEMNTENATAFVIGLTAMKIVETIMTVADKLKITIPNIIIKKIK